MRHFYTSVLERLKDFGASFATEPYEVAWATEAIFFVRTHHADAASSLESIIEISADGIEWVPEGTTITWPATPGTAFARVAHFGGWLRLRTTVPEGASARVTIQLALKE